MDLENNTLRQILQDKAPGSIAIFEGKECFYLYGDDAKIAVEYIFGNESRLDYTVFGGSSERVQRYYFVEREYEKVIRDLIIRLQYSVVHYICENGGDWNVIYQGSPTFPNDFEPIVGESAQLATLSSTLSVKLTFHGQFNDMIEIAYCNTRDYTISSLSLNYNANFSTLEHAIVAMGAKEVYIYQDDMKYEPKIFKKLESVLNKIQITVRVLEKFDVDSMEDVRSFVMSMIQNPEEVSLSDKMIENIYNLIKNMDLEKELGSGSELLRYQKFILSQYVVLNSAAVEALELFNITARSYSQVDNQGTLFSLLNNCRTPGGSRLLEEWIRRPLVDVRLINQRQDIVESLYRNQSVRNLFYENFLRKVPDITSISRRLVLKKSSLKDCVDVFYTVKSLEKGEEYLSGLVPEKDKIYPSITTVFLNPLRNFRLELESFIKVVGRIFDFDALNDLGDYRIVPNIDDGLMEINKKMKNLKNSAEKELSAVQKCITGYTFKLETSDTGFTIRVTVGAADLVVKNSYKIIRNTKATGCVFITDGIADINETYSELLKIYKEREAVYIEKLLEKAYNNTPVITKLLNFVAQIDVFVSLAVFASSPGMTYVRPNILEPSLENERILSMKSLRHPVVETSPFIEFIPNDIELSSAENSPRFMLITGANMAGKSTYLRSVALAVLLGQIGSFVPCDEATFTAVDGIFTRIGARDYQEKGISTFMDEMLDCGNSIAGATPNSLVIVDELGRGTSTFDGVGIAHAAAEEFIEKKCFTLFATHYSELCILGDEYPNIVTFYKADSTFNDEDGLILLYKMVPGIASKSFGIEVAEALKLPGDFINLAKDFQKIFSKSK
uniref:DNA_MISMATCH_REPAIR_2 domain-containing protein n=1 Tax=Parastrongyloides trichosuri TaxID=131310 RepID=A0A0N4ZR18_PARTI